MFKAMANQANRFSNSADLIERVYQHQNQHEMPVIIAEVNYWLTGEQPDLIPPDYFNNFRAMTNYQLTKIEHHLETITDDYLPFLFPWFGTGVVPSAFGCEIIFPSQADPAVGSTIIKKPAAIKSLVLPNPAQAGLMPKVLDCIDYMRKMGRAAGIVYRLPGPVKYCALFMRIRKFVDLDVRLSRLRTSINGTVYGNADSMG